MTCELWPTHRQEPSRRWDQGDCRRERPEGWCAVSEEDGVVISGKILAENTLAALRSEHGRQDLEDIFFDLIRQREQIAEEVAT